MSGADVKSYLESYSRRLWSGARSCRRDLTPKVLAVLEDFDKTRAKISELIDAADDVADFNDRPEFARLRAALAAVRPTPTPKEPT